MALSDCYFRDWETNNLLFACCKLNFATPSWYLASLNFYLRLESIALVLRWFEWDLSKIFWATAYYDWELSLIWFAILTNCF